MIQQGSDSIFWIVLAIVIFAIIVVKFVIPFINGYKGKKDKYKL
jgi:hypothetical protein